MVGGVLFAFSAFVMDALGRLPPDRAVEAMRSINDRAPTPSFMLAMFGTAVTACLVAAGGLSRLEESSGQLAVAGAIAYLASLAITMVFHVPANDRLARTPVGDDHVEAWARYARPWTLGNHVRAGLAIAAAALFVAALVA
ncbi:membrane protein [Microbacterium album]|uniref:Membrane protein n=1 Tax=Microbacterium album TaxID=2053191 RepID=A0A917ICQ9_9MICO|nr:membrane protein [Microbacterium album]